MGIFKKFLDILFGRDPAIFNDQGDVQHQLGKKVWDDWKNKYRSNPQNNWRNHSGTKFKKN